MSALAPQQIAFIERRRRQIRYWPWLALLLTLVLGGLYAWVWRNVPWFLDPQALVQGVQRGKIDTSQLATLAALGNLAFIGCGLLILVIILFTSVALWNEHRLIRYLDQLRAPAALEHDAEPESEPVPVSPLESLSEPPPEASSDTPGQGSSQDNG